MRTQKTFVWLSGASQFATALHFTTYVLFLRSLGMDFFFAGVVNVVFYVTLSLFEIPTGVVADVFGRKISYVVSRFIIAFGFVAYFFADSFWSCALAEFVLAIGMTFQTGAFDAWCVEELKAEGREDEIPKAFAGAEQATQAGGLAGAWVGAFVSSNLGLAAPWFIGGVLYLGFGFLGYFLMREKHFIRGEEKSLSERSEEFKQTFLNGLRAVKDNSRVRFIFLIGSLYTFACMGPNMQWQPFFFEMVKEQWVLGWVYTAISLSIIFGSRISGAILNRMEDEEQVLKLSILIFGIWLIVTVLVPKNIWFALPPLLIHEFARGIFRPVKNAYLNSHLPSKERATAISFEAIAHHAGGGLGLLVSGYIAENYGISASWFLSGAVVFLAFALKGNGHNLK